MVGFRLALVVEICVLRRGLGILLMVCKAKFSWFLSF